jgi:hypothetical protein
MNDTGSFVAAVLRELAASTAVILAAWGALGGATNALTTKMRLAVQLETMEKTNEVQRRMLEAAARRPRRRDELVDRLHHGRF